MTPPNNPIEQIKQRLEKATQGPWKIDPRNLCFYNKDGSLKELSNELCLDENNQNSDFLGASVVGPIEPGRSDFVVRDAWFIANARTDIEKLLKAYEILERAVSDCTHPLCGESAGNFKCNKCLALTEANEIFKTDK